MFGLFGRWIRSGNNGFRGGRAGRRSRASRRRNDGYFRRLRLEPLESRTLLTVLTVVNTDNSGSGSLPQEAIGLANTFTDTTITFAPGLHGAIDLSTSEGGLGTLTLASNVTIQGPSDNSVTIEGGASPNVSTNAQVFVVNPGVTAVLNNLTISNGYTTGWAPAFATSVRSRSPTSRSPATPPGMTAAASQTAYTGGRKARSRSPTSRSPATPPATAAAASPTTPTTTGPTTTARPR